MPKDKKKKRESSDSDSGSGSGSDSEVERDPPPKKQKKAPQSKATKKKEDNEVSWNLSADKIVKVREFKGKLYVDIRQYYNSPSGDLLPTKKGISLTTENYQKLKLLISEIDDELKKF